MLVPYPQRDTFAVYLIELSLLFMDFAATAAAELLKG